MPVVLSILIQGCLLWILGVDLVQKKIPNKAVLMLFILGILSLFYLPLVGVLERTAVALGLSALFFGLYKGMAFVLKKTVLGFGDVKLAAPLGLLLSVSSVPLYLILTGTIGLLFALIWRVIFKEQYFPFAPSMILSLWILKFFER